MKKNNSSHTTALKREIRCKECGMKTYQKDRYCVICKIGIRQMHEELCYLLTKDKNWVLLQKIYTLDSE